MGPLDGLFAMGSRRWRSLVIRIPRHLVISGVCGVTRWSGSGILVAMADDLMPVVRGDVRSCAIGLLAAVVLTD
jgi:hypothetical protein